VPLVLLALLAVTACSGSTASGESLADRLQAAKRSVDHAKYIGFTLSSEDLPGGVTAVKSAKGTGTHAPAFTGTIQIVRGLTFSAALRAVGGKVYAQLPFVGWTTIDPATYGAPDPAVLMGRQHGLSSLLTETEHPRNEGSERSGSAVLTKIGGTLPASDVRGLFGSAGQSDFTVTYALTSTDALQSVLITGPFYAGHADTTYSIVLDLSAAPVTVTPPS
jgi:lipoprotein LprG